MEKQKLFSVTRDDFEWSYFRGTGAGGQKKNKTSSACRCVHPPSGAVGSSQEDRQQHKNRQIAFNKCVQSPQFQNWLKMTTAAMMAGHASIERQVDAAMKEENIRVEYFTP